MAPAGIENIARIVHEANRAYCKTIGDDSQFPWDEAPQWQRDSMMNGVLVLFENPGLTPRDLHESWMAQKKSEGWVYGEVKDPQAKTHPCMVGYDELPEEQKTKDYIFHAIAKVFLT